MKSTKKKKIVTVFPEEILEEIFLRLPRRSLKRFRCLNKSYCALFDSRSFQGRYNDVRIMNKNTSILFHEAERKKIYMIDYKSISSLLPLTTKSSTKKKTSSSRTKCDQFVHQMDYPCIFQDYRKVKFLSSCNGLVWMSCDENFYIWNPSTKVHKKIPMPRKVLKYYIDGFGFGYDCETGDYKLVRIIANHGRDSSVDVYTLGSENWKTIESIPYYLYYKQSYSEGVLYNGSLHWVARTSADGSITLISFDILNERFEEVAMPEVSMRYPYPDIYVGILGGGCLGFVFHIEKVRIDVWVMQDYGVRQSWIKSSKITHKSMTKSSYLELIWSFKNNETLWEVDRGFILYEPNHKTCRKLVLDISDCSERKTVARDYLVSSVSL